MLRFILKVLINGVAIWLASLWIGGIDIVAGSDAPETGEPVLNTVIVVAVVALIFTLVNAIVKPIVKMLALPLYLLTLGLFFLVVNALMLMLTSWISGQTSFGLTVDGFWTAVLGALVISIISLVLSVILPDGERKTR
ncbi:phage holin family protein [Pseudactinotalea suaedae]|uniref:phage holin family protein n=1 Tax=Pseudactinotalea suaedae TaxID=1524924 RepID=UPI0012E2196D|nr:phage holin family protein [Pseudactinotalea suaedae]